MADRARSVLLQLAGDGLPLPLPLLLLARRPISGHSMGLGGIGFMFRTLCEA